MVPNKKKVGHFSLTTFIIIIFHHSEMLARLKYGFPSFFSLVIEIKNSFVYNFFFLLNSNASVCFEECS